MSGHFFISDLHLDKSRPEHINSLVDFLHTKLKPGYTLYILGDLFEVWLGDDIGLQEHQHVCQLLRQQVDSGVSIYVQHGNRDFLLGEAFAKTTGCQLIGDETVITINHQPVLLMHGDSLATDDQDYQALRKQVRNPQWQQGVLAKTATERIAMAEHYRQQSQIATANKADNIMDVNLDSVAEVMAKHNVSTLIHGHTHRPKVHQDDNKTRIVLGDWHKYFDYLSWEDGEAWQFLRQCI